jgi:ankyrin repeat protein
MKAACKGHHEVVSSLITSGADVDKKDKDSQTALHRASEVGQLKVVEVLLNAGAKVDVVDRYHVTPLMKAA